MTDTTKLTLRKATEIVRAAREYATGPTGLHHEKFHDRCADLLADLGYRLPATERAWDGSDYSTLKAMAKALHQAAEAACAVAAPPFELRARVEGGDTEEDYDTGRVVAVDGDQVTVAWDTGTRTTQHFSLLRPSN
ncbi:MAG: hypothetical protein ACK5TQ_03945 [Acetobacteraceae bacterium]|jgi:hypothetical protein